MVEFVSVEEAKQRLGLRVVTVGLVPSPWSEATKGILYHKKIPYVAARLTTDGPAVKAWTGHTSAPIAVYENDAPRTGWAEILLLAERLAPTPALVPANPEDRALLFGLSHEICGEDGLGWARRLHGVHVSLAGGVGFPKPIAQYLGAKYGYRGDNGEAAGRRVIELLGMFARRLKQQRQRGSRYLIGDAFTAADIYLATFIALFDPLPNDLCPIPDDFRSAFSAMDDATRAALDPVLLEHRDEIYRRHLELPLTL
ncbi:MAG TPA: glutathione S-transferase C-terminal domain-containing protein [Candidatus Binatia bacterium]|nr:glutathione S-transferase C-terminal domain-containing protein [Candidatus Binatia bacterium]